MKIELTPCYIVGSWSTEIVKAKGYLINELHENCWQSAQVITVVDGVWSIHPARKVFFDIQKANEQLIKEKQAYVDYLKKEVLSNQKKLEELSK